MENKKSNVGWIILTIVLLLIISELSFIILKDKGIIKIGNNTKENTKTETKAEEKKEQDSKKNAEKKNIIAPETFEEGTNDLGKIIFGRNEYDIKVEKSSSDNSYTTYIGDKKIDDLALEYVAVMGEKYLAVKGNLGYTSNQRLYIYDTSLNEAVESSYVLVDHFTVINDDGSSSDTTPHVTGTRKYTKDIIDSNHLIIAECTPARNSANYNQDYVEKLYSFENGKVEIEELTVVENIFCSAQR